MRTDRFEVLGGLAERIERHIEGVLCARIRSLNVVCPGQRTLLQSPSRTYYAQKLAQESALDITNGCARLVNETVLESPRRAEAGRPSETGQ